MKPLILAHEDGPGGAGRAAYRLHCALQGIGVESAMLVSQKRNRDLTIEKPVRLDRVGLTIRSAAERMVIDYAQRGQNAYFSPGSIPGGMVRRRIRGADLLHLHWINSGFLQPEDLSGIKVPVFWTLHDMWPFTGGCHYNDGCQRHLDRCGRCPMVRGDREFDLTRLLWYRKNSAWRKLNLHVIAPSRWMAAEAVKSSLFRDRPIVVVPNAVDTDLFRPIPRDAARSVLNIPRNARVVIFGAIHVSETRKGLDLLYGALELLAHSPASRDLIALIIGSDERRALVGPGGIRSISLGSINDERLMALAFAASNAAIVPSRQENLSNMIAESLACGVPAVAFDVGGNADLITHEKNGLLVPELTAEALAAAIERIVLDPALSDALGAAGRLSAEARLAGKVIGAHHIQLYEQALLGSIEVGSLERRA